MARKNEKKTTNAQPVKQDEAVASIVYMRLDELAGWPRNPKLHDLKSLRASIERFGFVLPLVLDEKANKITAGHGRLEVLTTMMREKAPVPQRITLAADGTWMVPVLRGVAFTDEREAEAYLIADNNLTEIGGWDQQLLVSMLADVIQAPQGVIGTGWSPEDAALLTSFSAPKELEVGEARRQPLEADTATYANNGVRIAALHYTLEEYKEFAEHCEALRGSDKTKSNAMLVMEALRAANRTPST